MNLLTLSCSSLRNWIYELTPFESDEKWRGGNTPNSFEDFKEKKDAKFNKTRRGYYKIFFEFHREYCTTLLNHVLSISVAPNNKSIQLLCEQRICTTFSHKRNCKAQLTWINSSAIPVFFTPPLFSWFRLFQNQHTAHVYNNEGCIEKCVVGIP